MRSGRKHLPNQPLAMSVAVRQGCIDEVQAKFEGAVQSPNRFIVRAAFPLFSPNPPRSIADLADFYSCSAKFSISHLPL
jgi:hypothetical protein